MLGLNEAMDWLAMVNSMCCYWHVFRRADRHVLGRALKFKIECNEGKVDKKHY